MVSQPPVVLYKVGQVYFVVDGHHRVSVAREQGQVFIEADVRECSTRVNITADIKPEDLEILEDKVRFLERTSLDRLIPEANIKLTIPDGFERMLEHIAVHRFFMGLDWKRHISEEEAIRHWYENVYLPVIHVIRDTDILKEFPGKTEGDLYLWVLDHQHYLVEEAMLFYGMGDAQWWLAAGFLDRTIRLSLLVGGGIALYFAALGLMGFRPRQFARRAAE